ncbi:SOS-response transcriptional repressors LexA [Candidatus Termititenax persephonae]|uniref:SOS-response transcriptional repressors LexA n=1 Tax=Candidatus Termititenax persephonae TaxID=2218525 RepID=A0A388TGE5_9BACT|nr:SOS-response transcriptional repressors LexA [Candidatus Termititenax persephonae]
MDPKQKKLLDLADGVDLGKLTLREISTRIGLIPEKPQLIKHHIEQLIKNGFLERDLLSSTIRKKKQRNNDFIVLPVLGSANCGIATLFAEENITGYVQVSPSTLPNAKKGLFIVKAKGDSMNRARVGAERLSIEDGDYVIVDSTKYAPKNKEYILSVINGLANIKKYIDDREKHCQIVLESESTKNYPPIFIHQGDSDIYKVCGIIVKVIKRPD